MEELVISRATQDVVVTKYAVVAMLATTASAWLAAPLLEICTTGIMRAQLQRPAGEPCALALGAASLRASRRVCCGPGPGAGPIS